MPLIKCIECKSEISSFADSCPHCGFPISDKSLKTKILVPAIPQEIWEGLKKATNDNRSFLNWKVNIGDWVNKGELLASYNVKSFEVLHGAKGKVDTRATIEAPISGKIAEIHRIEYAIWDWKNIKMNGSTFYWSYNEKTENMPHLNNENILFSIHTPYPKKSIKNLDLDAYSVYENIVDFGYFAKAGDDKKWYRRSMFDKTDFPMRSLEGLANSRLRIEELD